ncbi:F0F1 ATP synthase subunit gamma [Sediminivirga luteola]|uniref:ATP synthase gamma chain n=1 Tax=Sediminivirga luteola TaxID=1774748 RepID=A0A8J2TWF0_9MICO|nr:F0F1 ATP synthase subunit gamma [Sediminivirga luteola]MCI2266549.1 F0F1 ATP synthase subunit gamma [Sediminivirga luteola]GGA07822.1 ATP synthase gamma chain [Sediminivirga luteola]
MGAQQRVFRQKIRSTQSLRKIFKAMELIAASRIQKAIGRVRAAGPYSSALTRAVSAVATHSDVEHTLTSEPETIRRSAVVVISADSGFAGAYASNVVREAEELVSLLRESGKEPVLYAVGRKAVTYYTFRERALKNSWEGFSETPTPEDARRIGEALLADFGTDADDGGIDEIYLVYTRFVNTVTQRPEYLRLLPLEIVDEEEAESAPQIEAFPLYEFEPDPESVLDALLPRYVDSRIFTALLGAAASYQAAKQTAMKTATDNADDLIKRYTRLANTARQAEITQELTEIVGGADALAASASAD